MNDDGLESGEDVAREIAMEELGAEGHSAQLQREQIEFLRAQTRLQGLQAEKLKAELHHLHAEDGNIAIANIREKLKLVFDVGLAVFGLALIALVGFVIWTAARSQSVIVDSFSVPPDLAMQGNTGTVVAGEVLDQLRVLQKAARGVGLGDSLKDAWSNDVKVGIPDTGVSLGDAMAYLRSWLGNDIHIDGNVVHAGDAIVLSVRGSSFPAKTFTGKPADLPQLTAAAAEYAYSKSEPLTYLSYLEYVGRDKEAAAFAKEIYPTIFGKPRAAVIGDWANVLADFGDSAGAIAKYREALDLDPELWGDYGNLTNEQAVSGGEEGALQTASRMDDAIRHMGWFDKKPKQSAFENEDYLRMNLQGLHSIFETDMAATHGAGNSTAAEQPEDAEELARMHDGRAAELELQTSPGAKSDPFVMAQSAFVRGLIQISLGDDAAALRQFSASDRIVSTSAFVRSNFMTSPACWAGLAGELSGQPRAAVDADIARGGHFVDCYRFKADILDHRGQWAAAQKQYAAAIALAPDMPTGYFSWGNALMRHRQFAAAIAKFALAHEKGPHWADPLKRWGDALVWMQRSDLALPKYEAAAKYAPHWGGLYVAWGKALDYLGHHDEAVVKYHKAMSLDLSGDEHWQLRGCCG